MQNKIKSWALFSITLFIFFSFLTAASLQETEGTIGSETEAALNSEDFLLEANEGNSELNEDTSLEDEGTILINLDDLISEEEAASEPKEEVGDTLENLGTKKVGDTLDNLETEEVGDTLDNLETEEVGDTLENLGTKKVGDTLENSETKDDTNSPGETPEEELQEENTKETGKEKDLEMQHAEGTKETTEGSEEKETESNDVVSTGLEGDENKEEDDKEEKKANEELMIEYVLFDDNKKVLETEISTEQEDIEIIKEDKIVDENEESIIKEVRIYSEEHFNNELIVYSEINEVEDLSNVEIYWLRNDKKIDITNDQSFKISFYDENNNGLYDLVSWIVPHLSEQIFLIEINFTNITEENTTESVEINVIKPINNSKINNPIEFDFDITYKNASNVFCNLTMEGGNPEKTYPPLSLIPLTSVFQDFQSLPNGNYEWIMQCWDNITLNMSSLGTTYGSFSVDYNFGINVTNKTIIYGDSLNIIINAENGSNTKIKIYNPITHLPTEINLNGNYPQTRTLNGNVITHGGLYIINVTNDYLENDTLITEEFSVADIELTSNKNNIKEKESINFRIKVTSNKKVQLYLLDFGDGESTSGNPSSGNIDITKTHTYEDEGTYDAELSILLEDNDVNLRKIKLEDIIVEELNEDDEDGPEITLIDPDDEVRIKSRDITFSYKTEDEEGKVDNCTFELYNSTGIFSVLLYTKTTKNPQENKRVDVELTKFDEGEYTWYVGCYDNSTNYEEKSREFTINYNNNSVRLSSSNDDDDEEVDYEKRILVEGLLDKINDFYDKEKTYSAEEKEALEDLGVSVNIDYYKKRLLQIDVDLKNNLKFMRDEKQREDRLKELNDEVDTINEELLVGIRVVDQYDYIKNIITSDINEIINDYMISTGTQLSNREIKKLAKHNMELQKYMTTSTNVKRVELEYADKKNEKITLVTKNIKIKDSSYETIIEVIPKEIAKKASDIMFLTDHEIVKEDPIFSLSINDLDEEKFVYYIKEFIPVKNLEDTDTILFQEAEIKKSFGITGLAIVGNGGFGGNFLNIIIFIILVVVLYYFITYIILIVRKSGWMKEEDVRRTYKLIKKAKFATKNNDLERARYAYKKIREYYPLLPIACKKNVFKEIRKIRLGIDKKDIFSMVREFEQSKREGRKEDAHRLYKNISLIYRRLPRKYREKVFGRINSSNTIRRKEREEYY